MKVKCKMTSLVSYRQIKNNNQQQVKLKSRIEKHLEDESSREDVLTLSLARDSDFDAIARRVQNRQKVVRCLTLRSHHSQDEPDWNSEPIRELFLEIASLETVEHVSLHNFGMHSNSLPLNVLTTLLSTSSPLKSFHLNSVSLMGTASDINSITDCLKQHQGLQSFRLGYCGFSTALSTIITLDPIVNALASHTSFEALEIWSFHTGVLGSLTKGALGELIRQSKGLRSLHVEGFVLDDDLIQDLAQALQCSTCLQKLDLHILKGSDSALLSLADAFRHNNTLQYLELFLSNSEEDKENQFLTQLATVLTTNASLKELRIHSYREVTELEEEAFAEMLEQNQTLQFLHLSGYQGDRRPKIEYFLTWNRRGRQPGALSQQICRMAAHQKARQQKQKEKISSEENYRGNKRKTRSHLNRPPG